MHFYNITDRSSIRIRGRKRPARVRAGGGHGPGSVIDAAAAAPRSLRPLALLVLAVATLAVTLLAACAGGDDEASLADTTSPDIAPADEAARIQSDDSFVMASTTVAGAAMSAEEAMSDADGASALAVPVAVGTADLGRDIIYRATISVQTDDVAAASTEAVEIVQELGGLVFSQTTRNEPEPRTEITFKVLPADFSTALERLAGIGTLVDQTISADDVTDRVVDLESRISTAETSVTRLRALLEEANDLEDVAAIERELLDRETTLEVLRGQLRGLRDLVDLATITLTITQSPTVLPDSGIAVAAWVSDDADDPCLGAQNLTVDPDSTVYFCLEVENTGASTLTDVSVRSRYVRLDIDAFEPRQGSFDRIAPGELLVAVLEVPVEQGRLAGRVATRGLEIEFEVEAVPVLAGGSTLQQVSTTTAVYLDSRSDESLPGFGDSVSEGADALGTIVGVALVVAGVMVPFLPFVAIIIALIWWRRRRRHRRHQGATLPNRAENRRARRAHRAEELSPEAEPQQ